MKTVLITGSNGLIGRKFLQTFHQHKDFKFVASSRSKYLKDKNISSEFISLDITNNIQVNDVFRKVKPDFVIHLAAMSDLNLCEKNREECKRINLDAVCNLADVCKKFETHLVHFSSDFVFSGEAPPYSESDTPNPLSYYGITKLQSEQYLLNSTSRNTIVRPSLVYGYLNNPNKLNIVTLVKKVLEGGKKFRAAKDQWRTPTFVNDLVAISFKILKKEKEGIFHVGGKSLLSIYEIAFKTAEFWKLDKELILAVSSESLTEPAKRPQNTELISKKLEKELGYEATSFEKSLQIMDEQMKAK